MLVYRKPWVRIYFAAMLKPATPRRIASTRFPLHHEIPAAYVVVALLQPSGWPLRHVANACQAHQEDYYFKEVQLLGSGTKTVMTVQEGMRSEGKREGDAGKRLPFNDAFSGDPLTTVSSLDPCLNLAR